MKIKRFNNNKRTLMLGNALEWWKKLSLPTKLVGTLQFRYNSLKGPSTDSADPGSSSFNFLYFGSETLSRIVTAITQLAKRSRAHTLKFPLVLFLLKHKHHRTPKMLQDQTSEPSRTLPEPISARPTFSLLFISYQTTEVRDKQLNPSLGGRLTP